MGLTREDVEIIKKNIKLSFKENSVYNKETNVNIL